MPSPEDEKDQAPKRPSSGDQATTPLSAYTPSGGAAAPSHPNPALKALEKRYDILAELGHGGMGTVFKARDRETDEVVALKVLNPAIAIRPDLIERFKAELRLARKITHKNVCRTHELLRFDDTVVISMEYVEGESLRGFLERLGSAPLRRGLEWAKQISSALTEAHTQGVVHRDLKPENIMIDRRGEAKVMDFGIARSIEAGPTESGGIIGTPAYMSPERVEGKPADARSDIYCLGLILYEMFVGGPAFRADSPLAFAHKQIHETPPPPRAVEPYLPGFLARAIEKCLEKKPGKRFQSAADLSAALAGEPEIFAPVEAAQEKEVVLPDRLARWQRLDWAILGGALLSAAIFALLFDRVFPYGPSAPLVSREETIQAARTIVKKYAPELGNLPYSAKENRDYKGYFPYLVMYWGLERAMTRAQAFIPSWNVQQVEPGSGTGWSEVTFRRDGLPAYLLFGDLGKSGAAQGKLPPTLQDVLPFAQAAAEDLFHVQVANVTPVPVSYDSQRRVWKPSESGKAPGRLWPAGNQGPFAVPVLWVLPGDLPGTQEEVEVVAARGKLVRASAGENFQAGIDMSSYFSDWTHLEDAWHGAILFGLATLGVYLWICWGLGLAKRLYRQNAGLAWWMSLVVTLGALGLFWRGVPAVGTLLQGAGPVLAPLAFIVFLLMYFVLFSVPRHYVSRTFPVQVKTAADLLKERWRAQFAGLAVVRGVMLAAPYLAFHAFCLFVLGHFKLAAAGTAWTDFVLIGGARESALRAASLAFVVTIVAPWLGVGLPVALLSRLTRRRWLVLTAATLFWVAVANLLPGAAAYPVLPLYLFSALQGLYFTFMFFQYDLVTLMAATLTIETWLLCFPLLRTYVNIEPWPYAATLLPWVLVVILGVAMWSRPQVATLWQRTKTVFE